MMRMVPRGMTAPKLLRAAALLVIPTFTLLVVPGSLVAEQSASLSTVRPGGSSKLRPKAPMMRRDGVILEISLEDYVQGISAKGGVVLDRAALEGAIQDLVESSEPLEAIHLQDLLAVAPRIRVSWHGISADLNRNSVLFLARRVVGRDFPVREITVGDLLTALPDISLSSPNSSLVTGEADLHSFSQQLRKVERFERTRTPEGLESHALQTEYLGVTAMLEQIRRDGSVSGEEAVYDAAFGRLFDQDRADAVPLLDAHRRLQEEVAATDLRSMTLSERISFRAEARRRAFGEEMAGKLFARQETIERYQVDLLALKSDPSLSDADRAERIADRQMQMKVELAEIGSQSGFVGQDRETVDAELRARYGDRFDRMSADELREARRRIYLERLPAELRNDADHIRGRASR